MKKKEIKKVYQGRVPTVKGTQKHKNKKKADKADKTGRRAKHKKAAN